jgi:two-component system chemotaxis sensor kinase CheA
MSNPLTSIRDTIVLPPTISAFENRYVRRMNRIALGFFMLHVPVFVLVAYFNATGPLLALGLTTAVLVGPALAYVTFDNPRNVSVVYGFTAMLMGGLLVHFGQGPVQIEMHFYFFALIAMLALFGNPTVILTAAVTVALHHLALWYLLPSSVFNYDAPIWVVLVHAAFVVLESVATVFIARSFFDNVIGLEKIVELRTQELDARNQEMRLVLDNVEQGLLTLDRDGVMSSQKSAIVDSWIGTAVEGQRFVDLLAPLAPATATAFEIAFEQTLMGILPLDVCLEQFPTKLKIGSRELSLSYTPITRDDELVQLLVVISDVTAAVERERLEAEQREVVQIFDRLLSDRAGFVEFFEEAQELVGNVASGRMELRALKRAIHTLKGNSLVFGVQSIAELCHEIETRIEEESGVPSEAELEQLAERWHRLEQRLSTVLGDNAGRIEVAPADYHRLLTGALRERPGPELARMVAELKFEPTSRRLERVSEQARRIARRLGKGEIDVRIDHGGLRLDPRRWSTFWSAFLHVVRNAVDHGLEQPQDRERLGKPRAGCLVLSTAREGAEFVIRVADDGKGVDWESVQKRAAAMGVPVASANEIEAALFLDGVSTAAEVTEVSGRGIGMGALRSACSERGGAMAISSNRGSGTTVEFRFPAGEMAPAPADLLCSAA